MTQLSPHFTYAELTFSEVALRKGLDNTPTDAIVNNLMRLCAQTLEPARLILGVPMHVNSGYRSARINALVGGAINSAHMQGLAADIIHDEVKSLHTRHDNHDQALDSQWRMMKRIRSMLVAALRFDGKEFLEAWRDDHGKQP